MKKILIKSLVLAMVIFLSVLFVVPSIAYADGSKIAFVSVRDGNYEIYIMNVDGSGQTNLTNNSAIDLYPSFSPDGSKIAFESSRDGNDEIYIMNVDGSGQTRLTNNSAGDYSPSFSPDGSKIAFASNRDGNNEIYIMNVDGSGQTNLTNNLATDFYPSFSPDGSKIAFSSDRDGNYEIYIMNVDGSGQTRLTNNSAFDGYPSFSPDGSKIAFSSGRDRNYEIYIMNVDGSGQTRLTNNSANDLYSSFSPDGSKIAFSSVRDGNDEIYIMNVDGSGQTNLTNNSASDFYPSFSPTIAPADTTAPVITLIGVNPTNVPYLGPYTEPGATWTDAVDGTGSALVSGDTVDVTTPGNYTIRYNYTDAAGNVATEVTRTVTVLPWSTSTINVTKNVMNWKGKETVDTHQFTIQKNGADNKIIAEGITASYDMLPPGTYIITELTEAKFVLKQIIGDNDSDPSNGATITVGSGQTVNLTFVNWVYQPNKD